MNYTIDKFAIDISFDDVGSLSVRLVELGYYLGMEKETGVIKQMSWIHEIIYYPALNPIVKIKESLKYWLARYSQELANKSGECLDDFLSKAENMKPRSKIPNPPAAPNAPPDPNLIN